MPRRSDLASIVILGAGPITIGQACEFDYSGVQAVKALRAEGYRVILVNSNPATLMTDPDLADATYIEPIRPEFVEKILARERPDALLPTMGGQTALNCALAVEESGVLARHGVEMIGATGHSIEKAEDRRLFREAMLAIGLEVPVSEVVTAPPLRNDLHGSQEGNVDLIEGVKHALEAVGRIGLPVIIRPAFTLGGRGGGVAYNRSEVETLAKTGLTASPRAQILIDECLIGWKEYEMEVVRDRADNAIIVCSIENVDPMGVHTGDSITVAPALTLTDREMQSMRDAAIAVIREIGVDTGGANVQFAVDPASGRMVVIEMNPRVSRSSALASKATGFPIAKVAARLAVGYTLDELANDVTGVTPASFEPTIDYVVTKIPRFAFEKYKGARDRLTTSMKSVGEAMAIGGNFRESIQKAICSLETGQCGFDPAMPEDSDTDDILAQIARPSPMRIFAVADAVRARIAVDDICRASGIDPWFVRQIEDIVRCEARIDSRVVESAQHLLALKMDGFSDARIGKLAGCDEEKIRSARHSMGVFPVFRRVDTCAGEFAARTPYMYSTYARPHLNGDGQLVPPVCEAKPQDRSKVVIIGGGPNRIGQGLEFDYCCCHAAFAMADMDISSIMVNCNPETVSTDYDTSDRLYFEPLTSEHVGEILLCESRIGKLLGAIVQFGGQTPLKLAPAIAAMGIPLPGTALESLQKAENRQSFSELIAQLGLRQPASHTVNSVDDAIAAADALGYPVLLRPSNVLGGRAMEIARNGDDMRRYATLAVDASEGAPLLIDRFLNHATEVDIDAISDGCDTHIVGVMQHIEEAGVHSGDSACSATAFSLPDRVVDELCAQTRTLASALSVRGLMNVQFAVQGDDIFVLETNPRASRTVPFMAKAVGIPFARIAAAVMVGRSLASFALGPGPIQPRRAAVKEAVFPFACFAGVDPVLGPEMRSTGEVMGFDDSFGAAFLKSQLAAGVILPEKGACFISVKDSDKAAFAELARDIRALGFSIVATDGTADYLTAHNVPATRINKVRQGRPHIVDAIVNGEIHMVINTTQGQASLSDSASIRRTALMRGTACYTTLGGGQAALAALKVIRSRHWLEASPLQDYTQRHSLWGKTSMKTPA